MKMKIKLYIFEKQINSNHLIKTKQVIQIKKNIWIDNHNITHKMNFSKELGFENNNVYFLHLFGQNINKDMTPNKNGKYISLTFFENQKFLILQNMHWLQKEENIRYIINILFLIIGIILSILNYIK